MPDDTGGTCPPSAGITLVVASCTALLPESQLEHPGIVWVRQWDLHKSMTSRNGSLIKSLIDTGDVDRVFLNVAATDEKYLEYADFFRKNGIARVARISGGGLDKLVRSMPANDRGEKGRSVMDVLQSSREHAGANGDGTTVIRGKRVPVERIDVCPPNGRRRKGYRRKEVNLEDLVKRYWADAGGDKRKLLELINSTGRATTPGTITTTIYNLKKKGWAPESNAAGAANGAPRKAPEGVTETGATPVPPPANGVNEGGRPDAPAAKLIEEGLGKIAEGVALIHQALGSVRTSELHSKYCESLLTTFAAAMSSVKAS